MSASSELCEQIITALERKLENRYRRAARNAGAAAEPGQILGTLSEQVAQELAAQESKYRDAGNEGAAQAFAMVRSDLLRDIVRDLFARVSAPSQ